MKPKYKKLFHSWVIPDRCWTENPAAGFTSCDFPTKTAAYKAIKLFKKLGRCLTVKDVEDL